MSAAESLSVGSVASIGSQVDTYWRYCIKDIPKEGVSQTSGALSIYGALLPAALSTTQPSVVSNNETALSAVHVDAYESRIQTGTTRLEETRRERLRRVGQMDGGHHQEAALQLPGVQGIDSVMAVAHSGGNDGASSVGQMLQGESAVEEQSVDVNAMHRMDCMTMRPMTRHFVAYMTANAALLRTNAATHQEAKVEQTDSLCSLAQSNSVEASGNDIGDEVESISGRTTGPWTSAQRSGIPLTDIPGIHLGSMSGGSGLQSHLNTWPYVEGDCLGYHQEMTDGRETMPNHEAGQTSVGMEPSDSGVVDQEVSMFDQGSLVDSNDGDESIGRQASLSVHQAMEMDIQTSNMDHYGIKRKDTSFDDGTSGKRRH